MHTQFCWGNLKERNQLKNLGVGGRIIFKCMLRKWDAKVWVGLVCFKTDGSGGLLLTRFCKIWGIFVRVDEFLGFQEGLCISESICQSVS
jgi:hypothetical protein